jgi:hypothetical protein
LISAELAAEGSAGLGVGPRGTLARLGPPPNLFRAAFNGLARRVANAN